MPTTNRISFKISEDLKGDFTPKMYETIISDNGNIYDRGLLYRPFDIKTLKFGYDGDDFVRNLITVAIDRKVFRVPSILKHCYRVKKYRPRRNHISFSYKYKKYF
mgnify:FL=1